MQGEPTRAVVLAAGRGSRMRAAADVALAPDQGRAADRGLKGLIPFDGHPFLSYVLTALADAGFVEVCLVVTPGADPIREHYAAVATTRMTLRFVVQDEPLGSAHALLAAESFSDGQDIVVINSDNFYPAESLRALRGLAGCGLVGFSRDGLLSGNIDADRIAGYALIETDASGALRDIIEKPDPELLRALAAAGTDRLISMTCWRFTPSIFDAIRDTPRSRRGEYELPDAVRVLLARERFDVIETSVPVLDLSQRADIPRVEALLRGARVDL